jgi:hypothetical protein
VSGIAYIVVVHIDYEGHHKPGFESGPLRVYLDRDEAEREARKLDESYGLYTGVVWEVQLP